MGKIEEELKTQEFMTPPKHVEFLAKKVFGEHVEISDVSIAHLSANGGGPTEPHSHPHDHLFVVVNGEVKVVFDDGEVLIHNNESFRVSGGRLHSMWNVAPEGSTVIGITIVNK